MGRRNPRSEARGRDASAVFSVSGSVVEVGADGLDYRVIKIPGARAVKVYRCPGCDHEIAMGVAHVVVWPVESLDGGVDSRRHWHTPCWANRANRGPTRRWS